MTKEQLNAVLDRVRSWPISRQEDAVRVLLAMEAQDVEPYRLSPEENEDMNAALAEMARGDVASDAEIAVVFRRYRG